MFILVLFCIALVLILVFAAFGNPASGPEPKTAKARRARKIIIEMTSGDLESAKAKIREAVRKRLPDLVQKRTAGIASTSSTMSSFPSSPTRSAWKSSRQV